MDKKEAIEILNKISETCRNTPCANCPFNNDYCVFNFCIHPIDFITFIKEK